MKKQLLLLVMILLPMVVSADDSGTCGDNLTWNYVEATHTLTISGNGKMKSYNSSNRCPWFQYGESIAIVVIEEGVTTIGSAAFQDCSGITAASIPQSVTTIGDNSFLRCSKLASISIPGKVTSITGNPFAGCSSLTSISVEAGNTVYDSRDNCNGIIETETNTLIAGCANSIIPQNIATIGYSAFFGCTGLTSVTIPNSVTYIALLAFQDCTGLISVTIPSGIIMMGERVFEGCTSLASINISVADQAVFCNNRVVQMIYSRNKDLPIKLLDSNGNEIKEYVIPNSVTSIGWHAFEGCSGLISITIPRSVTSIEGYAFANCSSLTSITIPNSVTSIGEYAFFDCGSLTSITIPNSVLNIGEYAFSGCKGLTTVTIPNSVTSIGKGAFEACIGLTFINVDKENTKYDSRDNCNGIIETGTNTLITGCQNTIIPTSVTSIGRLAFSGCTSMTKITIPPTVTSIISKAFYQCSGLKIVNINDIAAWCNTSIDDSHANPLSYAKHLCLNGEEISDLVIPNGVTQIKNYVFYGCSSFTSVTIPASVTEIDAYVFEGCRIANVMTKNSKTKGNCAFSDRTYQHAMLYIPEGTWGEAVYDGDWYMFNNIRETAMDTKSLSPKLAYMLVDTKTFNYAVYDGANSEVKMAKAFYNLDENDLNNSWAITMLAGKNYLYNLGARKYAKFNADGSIVLTDDAEPITLTEAENGIMIGSGTSRQWGFVKNTSLPDVTRIVPQTMVSDKTNSYYSISGTQLQNAKKGLNIVKTSNGIAKKVIMK